MMRLFSSTVMASAFKLILLITATSVLSFMSGGKYTTYSVTKLYSSKPPSYAELLQAAKLAKQNGGVAPPRQPAPRQTAPVATVAKSAPVQAQTAPRNSAPELPFDDAMYDHLKFVIGKLSARMKSTTPLTADELARFKDSCLAIISDSKPVSVTRQVETKDDGVISTPYPKDMGLNVAARRNGKDEVHKAMPIVKKFAPKAEEFVIHEAGEGPPSEDEPDPNSPFADLHGLSNTWQMPGMDHMTTDEYYKAINKRIVDMKNKRKSSEGSSNTMVNDYFESLSKPRSSE